MRDFIKPLRVARPRMDQGGQPERRYENVLALFAVEIPPVDVALNVARERVFRPLPIGHGLRVKLQLARRGREAANRSTVYHHSDRLFAAVGSPDYPAGRPLDARTIELRFRDRGFVLPVNPGPDGEGRVAAHVIERREPHARGLFRKAGNAVLKYPPVVLFDADLGAGPVGRLEVLANAEFPRGVDSPGEFDPELILLPYLSRVGLVRVLELFALALSPYPRDRLPEGYPLGRMGLLALQVVALGPDAHRQDVVCKPG